MPFLLFLLFDLKWQDGIDTVRVWWSLKPLFHQKARSCSLPNANKKETNNMKSAKCKLYFTTSSWALRWVHEASCWVYKAFRITTCWYRQYKSLTLGAVPSARPQREGFAFCSNIGLKGLQSLLTKQVFR